MPELLIDYDKQAKAEIKESLDKVARGTQRVAMEASLAAAEEMLAAIKAAAPSDSGTLRAGLVLHAEKNRKRRGKPIPLMLKIPGAKFREMLNSRREFCKIFLYVKVKERL